MASELLSFPAKICFTAAGCLIHQNKVLLVKHKKLGFWLNPGGHLEENELPHQTAEREFWEETGVRVRAADPLLKSQDKTEYLPNPFASNLHWACRENFEHRVNGAPLPEEIRQRWSKGCEQHISMIFLMEPLDSNVAFFENVEETDGIQWFTLEELENSGTAPSIIQEVRLAFQLRQQLDSNK